MTTPVSKKKRELSPLPSSLAASNKKPRRSQDLLDELTDVLAEIKSTPSSGEIPAELLENFKLLMIQIERMSSDQSDAEAVQMRHESERCLESWFDELLARCEADGALDLDTLEQELAAASDSDEDDIEAALSLALALDDDHPEGQEEDEEEEVVVDDDDDDVKVAADEPKSPVQVVA